MGKREKSTSKMIKSALLILAACVADSEKSLSKDFTITTKDNVPHYIHIKVDHFVGGED